MDGREVAEADLLAGLGRQGDDGFGMTAPVDSGPRVVIVGAGFGGLRAAKALAGAPVRLTVVDRRSHHLFQPLLTSAIRATPPAWAC